MKSIEKLFLTLIIVSATFVTGFAQIIKSDIDEHVTSVLQKFNVPGAAIGIVKGGEVFLIRGYGVKNVESGNKVDAHSQFAIASNTKAFTSTALAILVDQGKINWDDKVINHIPEFKMYNDYVTQNFIIEDLLTHRSGLGLGAGDLTFIPDGTTFTIDDIVTMFQHFEPASGFRTQYDYDNILYMVAGELIKRVTGLSWEEYVQENILKPLDMEDAYSHLNRMPHTKNLTSPHIIKEKDMCTVDHFEKTINGAAGGLYASVSDLTKWMQLHLNEGKYGTDLKHQLFTKKRQREMWKVQTPFLTDPVPPYNTHFSGYGLGWHLQLMNGRFVAYHGGLLPGMASLTVIVPELDFGMVALTNGTTENGDGCPYALVLPILDQMLGLKDNQWVDKMYEGFQKSVVGSDSINQAVWKIVEEANDSHIIAEHYIGTYQDPWFGQVQIEQRDGQLWFQSKKSAKLNGPMRWYKSNTFAIRWEYQDMNGDAFAIFSLDEEGKAEAIRMKGISPNIDFSFDFQDLDFIRME